MEPQGYVLISVAFFFRQCGEPCSGVVVGTALLNLASNENVIIPSRVPDRQERPSGRTSSL
jgi:hypothetical protein